MTATAPSMPTNPWRALWFSPRTAIDAFTLRPRPWTIAGLVALSSAMSFLWVAVNLSPRPGPAQFTALAGMAALAGAVMGLIWLYIGAALINGVAHWIGGAGTARGVRAATALSLPPNLLAVGLAMGLGPSLGGAGAAGHALALAPLIGALWSLVVFLVMLARVQQFGLARAFLANLCVAILSLGAPLLVRALLFQPFSTPSSSMSPGLQVGDYFFAAKYPYGYSRYSLPFAPDLFRGRILGAPPARGDVIVFRHPSRDSDYVKRIIGLPGDRIRMQASRLYINGALVERRPLTPGFVMESPYGGMREAPSYIETLPGGASYPIVQTQGDHGVNADTEEFVTPPGQYFVLGDNRDNSTDSRLPPDQGGVGFVPFENIEGRAAMIYYSQDGSAPPRLRRERIGVMVK